MCGICGKVYYDQHRPVERGVLTAMCDTMMHRGPDSQGVHIDGAAGIGSTRLSIIDVPGGRMPIPNEDETVWIVFNGEIYNYQHLRERLERAGHRFTTHSDTETILHLYEEVGDSFAEMLNGMFAVAIWDSRRRRLVLARDHVGIKPLFYAELKDRLLFGSEIKPLLVDGVDRSIDPIALHDYLSLNYVPGPRTIFSSVRKLLPGHIMTYEARTQQTQIRRFWDIPRPDPVLANIRASANLEDELLNLLRQIVRDQMVSDVPLGSFLSGGLDSSLLVALMSEVSDRPVKTFSVGFNEESYSELPYARIVAERFGTDHHELVLAPKAHDMVMSMAEYFDEPFADSSALPTYAISGVAAKHVTVALSGDGGDEVFGGYYTYQADKIASLYRRLPQALGAGLLPRLVSMMPVSDRKASLDFKLKRFMTGGMLPPLSAHVAWKSFFSEDMKSRLYAANGNNGNGGRLRPSVDVMQAYFDGYPTKDMINRLMYVDSKVQLVDDMLTKTDRVSMAHSLEVRVPLLDLRLVEFMARMPSHLKVHGMTLKYLMKRVGARVLPHEIMHRPKAGFNIPIARWLRTDLSDMVNTYLSPNAIADQGLFDPQEVSSMLQAHFASQHDYSRNIWNLLMFSLWHERYVKSTSGIEVELGSY